MAVHGDSPNRSNSCHSCNGNQLQSLDALGQSQTKAECCLATKARVLKIHMEIPLVKFIFHLGLFPGSTTAFVTEALFRTRFHPFQQNRHALVVVVCVISAGSFQANNLISGFHSVLGDASAIVPHLGGG